MRPSVIASVCAIGIAVAVLLAWPRHQDRKPHAFRLVFDRYGDAPTKLVWLDGKSPPIDLGEFVDAKLFSPDRRQVVFGSDVGDERLRFVDLVTRRVFFTPRVVSWPPGGCAVSPRVWSGSGRVVATGWCGNVHSSGASTVTVVDPEGKRVLATRGIGVVLERKRTGGRAILLASPPLGPVIASTYLRKEFVGPARLIRIGRDGTIAQVVLHVRAGYSASRTFNREPGLTVRGDRAIVVGEGDGAAEVDLRTLSVRYHEVPFPPRPRRLAPSEPHTGTSNPSRDLVRDAAWIDDRYVAVAGYDRWTRSGDDELLSAGLRVLDTRSWTTRLGLAGRRRPQGSLAPGRVGASVDPCLRGR